MTKWIFILSHNEFVGELCSSARENKEKYVYNVFYILTYITSEIIRKKLYERIWIYKIIYMRNRFRIFVIDSFLHYLLSN